MANRFKCLKPNNNDDGDKPNDNKYRVNRRADRSRNTKIYKKPKLSYGFI